MVNKIKIPPMFSAICFSFALISAFFLFNVSAAYATPCPPESSDKYQADCVDMDFIRSQMNEFKADYDKCVANPPAGGCSNLLSRYQNAASNYESNFDCWTPWAGSGSGVHFEGQCGGRDEQQCWSCFGARSQYDPINSSGFFYYLVQSSNENECIMHPAYRSKRLCEPLDTQIQISADKLSIPIGDQFTISWKVLNGNYGGIGAVIDANPRTTCKLTGNVPLNKLNSALPTDNTFNGSQTFRSVQKGIYTITYTCTGILDNAKSTEIGSVSRDVRVCAGVDCSKTPKVNDFSFATPNADLEDISKTSTTENLNYQLQIGKSFKLKWDVENIDEHKDARSVTVYQIKGGAKTVLISTNAKNNSDKPLEITPVTTGIYDFQIEVKNEEYPQLGTDVKDIKLRVYGVIQSKMVDVDFTANKTEVTPGETVTLSWNAPDASEVTINQDIGKVDVVGTTEVNPNVTTTYSLTAKSPIVDVSSATKILTITVKNATAPSAGDIKTEAECVAAGYYWYGGACHTEPQIPESSILLPSNFTNEADCIAAGFYWYDGACHAQPAIPKTDLKVNGIDGPVTLSAPATFKISWAPDAYCIATGAWLDVKLKSGSQDITLKKNGKYTYSLYCAGYGTDSVEVNIVGGTGANANTGLIDSLSGKNTDALSLVPTPVAEAAVSTDGLAYSQNVKVIRGRQTNLYIRADIDISGDGLASRDADGIWGNLMSEGGRCLYNTKLVKGTPVFDGMIENPLAASSCNARLGSFVFNDEPGVYQYGIMELQQNDDKYSNVAYIFITVENPPPQETLPVIDLRINGDSSAEQVLGTPASYSLSWHVMNADTCQATGSWSGTKDLDGSQDFVSSIRKDFAYTLSCTGTLGTSLKTISLKVMESPDCTFTAMPPSINKSSAFVTESELSWKCSYADACVILPPPGNTIVKTYGTARVSPNQTTTYALNCENAFISKSFETTVEVQ